MRPFFALSALLVVVAAQSEAATISLTQPQVPSWDIFAQAANGPAQMDQGNGGPNSVYSNSVSSTDTFAGQPITASASSSDIFGSATSNSVSVPLLSGAATIPNNGLFNATAYVIIKDRFYFSIDSTTPYVFTGTLAGTGAGNGGVQLWSTQANGGLISLLANPTSNGPFSFVGVLAPGYYLLNGFVNFNLMATPGIGTGTQVGTFQASGSLSIPEPSSCTLGVLGALSLVAFGRRIRRRRLAA